MTDTVTILSKAREIIADPGMWYKGDWTASGRRDTDEPCDASCAIWRAAHSSGQLPANIVRHVEKFTPGQSCLGRFNDADTTTHTDVLAVFDRAIAVFLVKS